MKKYIVGILAFGLVACGAPSPELETSSNSAPVSVSGVSEPVAQVDLPILTGAYVWQVDKLKSSVGFEALEQGASFPGKFERFELAIKLDPDNPESGQIDAIIDLASVEAGTKERNQVLPTQEWFDIKNFAQATFSSRNIIRKAAGEYEARGELSLKGISKEIVLPFTLDHDGKTAHATGKVSFNRVDFNVGEGSYKSEEYIDHKVVVSVDIYAAR